MDCSLCQHKTSSFFKFRDVEYLHCSHCGSVMVHPNDLIKPTEEKKRYDTHNNDVNSEGYRSFVKPLVDLILHNENVHSSGLDFGAGPGPVISVMLSEKGYKTKLYDPFYHINKHVLSLNYDYIICCEVMEHFHFPDVEFKRLANLLKTGGRLYCKTLLFNEDTDFSKWWYKNDETHVFFYTQDALSFICKEFGFKSFSIVKEVIVFQK